jgi:hypothetical protein
MKKLFPLLLFILARGCGGDLCPAQTVAVSTTYLRDGGSLANGQICWNPVLATGGPTVYRWGGGGMSSAMPICATVTNGVSNIAAIPDSCFTTPLYLCWRVTLITGNGNGSSVLGSCVQPSASNYWFEGGVDNFDNWQPNGAALNGTDCRFFAIDENGVQIVQSPTIAVLVSGIDVASLTSIASVSFDNPFAIEANGAQIAQSSTIAISVGGVSVASATSITSIFVNGSVL